MKDTMKSRKIRRGLFIKIMTVGALLGLGSVGAMAQNSLPAPGTGGGFNPAPVGPPPGGPGAPFGPGGPGAFGGPAVPPPPRPGISIGFNIGGGFANQGTTNVVACGYDNTGVFRTIPMTVSYTFGYGQYDVTVLSAYNPFTMSWMPNIDMPAYNTSYFLRGQTYDFYAPLSTGPYYFNL